MSALDTIRRIAERVLKQAQPSTGDWIEWKGGECPVDGAARVEVKYADGTPGYTIAGSLRWSWIFDVANGGDIIAYRVVKGEPA